MITTGKLPPSQRHQAEMLTERVQGKHICKKEKQAEFAHPERVVDSDEKTGDGKHKNKRTVEEKKLLHTAARSI